MEQAAFIDLVRQTVLEPATSGTISQIESPTGRNLSEDRKRRSTWFRALSPDERAHVEYAIAQAAHAATFGFLCVIDGARVIEDGADRGHLELHHVKGKSATLLASGADEMLVAPLHKFL